MKEEHSFITRKEGIRSKKNLAANAENPKTGNDPTRNGTNNDFDFQDDSLNGACLRHNLSFLCENLTLNPLLVHLEQSGTLTKQDAATIRVSYIYIAFPSNDLV